MDPSSQDIGALYERHAKAWDRARAGTLLEKAWLDRFRDVVGPRGAVLDLGCGGGDPVARYLVERGHRVTGVDSSPSLIGVAARRFAGGDWIVRDMRGLSLGTTFAGLVAWDSFFHLTVRDQRAMFPVFRAHAAPGAALLFTSGPREGEAIGSFEGDPLYHASLGPDEYRALLAEHGFGVVAHVPDDQSCGGHTVWLARRCVSGDEAGA